MKQYRIPRGTSSRLQYYVLTLSLGIVPKMAMVPLYPRLLSGCSLLTAPEAAEDVPALVSCGGTCRTKLQHLNVKWFIQLLF